MMTPTFRKTLLALAITGAALPAYAQTLTLTNAGIVEEDKTYSDTVEVNGSFSGSNGDDAIEFNSVTFQKDLIINATVNGSGNNSDGLDLSESDLQRTPTEILGSLINKGSLSVEGGGASAMLIDPAIIHGSLINEGTLSAKGEEFEGEGVRTLEFSGVSEIHGKLINEGLISASGSGSTALSVEGNVSISGYEIRNEEGATISATGKNATGVRLINLERFGGVLLNDGKISVSGEGAKAIDVQGGYIFAIDSEGEIIAAGDDSHGIAINGTQFDGYNGYMGYPNDRHIRNSGLIQADDAAILIESFTIDTNVDGENLTNATVKNRLGIEHLGHIVSKDEAIDASLASGDVDLYWGIADPNDEEFEEITGRIKESTITGNLIGLSNIEIRQNAVFTGTDATVDGANIVMKNSGWVNVGSVSDNLPGHLELGLPHTTIDGNLYVAGNSSLGLNLSSATDPNKAVLGVSGTAEFGDGAQIKLAAKGSDFRAEGTTYTLVEAGSIENDGLQVVSSSSLLNVDTYAVEGNRIVSKVTAKGAEEVVEVIQQTGASGNAQAAGSVFYNDVFRSLAAADSSDPVVQAYLAASQDPAALKKLTEQLAPETNGGATQAALTGQSLISNVTGSRTSGARGMSSGDSFQETGVWVQGLYSDANQDLRDGVAGYSADSRGIAVGADGKLNDQLTIGLAYSFINTDVNGDSGNDTEVDGHALTLYSGYELGNYFVDASLTYGVNDNSSKRLVAGTTAKGDYDSDLLGLNLVGGYGFHLDNGLLIEPRVAARYSNVKIDSYREKGSSAALAIEDQRYEVAELGAGVRLAGSFAVGQGTLEPQVKLIAYHDFAADQAASTSTFVLGSTPFVTSGAKPERNGYEAGVGVDYLLGAVTLSVGYEYFGKTDFDADTVHAKLRYDF